VGRGRARARGAIVVGAVVALTLAACTSAPAGPGTASPSVAPSGSASGSASASAQILTLTITISGGKVTPNGQKIDAHVGQQVVMHVTSDIDDEVHAHTGGDGYELEVPAGKPTSGTFTLTSPGSFEVESHHLGKVIVILNAR
jgi:hypothetical protein